MTETLEFKLCVWFKGSTNPIYKQAEPPQYCKLQQCKGYNDKCEFYKPIVRQPDDSHLTSQ